MAWSYKIEEINKPRLTEIRVQFTLKDNGSDYVTENITLSPQELSGKTNAEKLSYIKDKISGECQTYIFTHNMADGLQAYVGSEINL